MNLRKTLAGTVLTAGLLLGGTSAAFAAAPPTARPPASAACKAAARQLHDLKVLDARMKAEYRQVVRLRDAAAKAGKTELVAKLDAKLAKMREAHAKVTARIKTVAAQVRTACAPAAPAA